MKRPMLPQEGEEGKVPRTMQRPTGPQNAPGTVYGQLRARQCIKAGIVASWVSIAAPTQGKCGPHHVGDRDPPSPAPRNLQILMRLISGGQSCVRRLG